MSEILSNLAKVLPQLLIIAALSGIIGWWLRGSPAKKTEPAKSSKPVGADKPQQDRLKNLEATLEKSKAAHKALKSELDALKATSITQEDHQRQLAGLETARNSLATESKRAAVLEGELRKAQETLKVLNARSNEANKAQKDRSFTLENELSKTRQQLAVLQNRPDDSTNLQAEIERLRESVATSTRYAGELRKREATAVEALERAQAQLASAGDSPRPVAARKIGPIGDTDRVAAAKAEVLRLVELNKQNAAASVPPVIAVAAAAVTQLASDTAEVVSAAPAIIDEEATPAEVPVTIAAEPEPIIAAEPEPIVVAEPEPVIVADPEPVIAAEPEPAVAVVAENVATPDTEEEDPTPPVKPAPAHGELLA